MDFLNFKLHVSIAYFVTFFVDEDSEQPDNDSISKSNLNPAEYKRSLMKLQATDPDFYEYLTKTDKKFLEYGVSDDDEDDDNSSVDSDDRHTSNENLKVFFHEYNFNFFNILLILLNI